MKRKIFAGAALALAMSSTPAFAIVGDYNGGATIKANQDGTEFEIREANAPGESIRVYVSPSKINNVINCTGVPPVVASGYFPSTLTQAVNLVSPVAGYALNLAAQPVLHDNPTCNTDKWGYFTMDTVKEGTAKFKVIGTLKTYLVEVTFGPDPSDASKTVVLRLRTNSV